MKKTLDNIDINETKKNVSDVVVFGDGDMFKLLCKASSKAQGWMKSTKAMDVGVGCVVQVTTQQINSDGSYSVAEAVTFIPGVKIGNDIESDVIVGRHLEPYSTDNIMYDSLEEASNIPISTKSLICN